ncbi:MAG: SMP-30/gluconolactonase/LRE family protein [Planctomycetaceae bacterium]|jgi:gluconolactonase
MPGRALSRWWLLVVPLSLAAGALGLAPGAAWAQAGPLLLPDAKLEKLFEGRVLTEGVAVAPDGQVYFSEITFSHVARDEQGAIEAGHIWRFDPTTGKTVIYRSPSGMSNGIKFDARGRMVVAEGADFGGRRVTRTDLATGKTHIIAGLYQGRPLNSPNDIAIDERGRVYFSDPRYLGHEPIDQGVQAVYRLDTDGTLHRVVTDAGKPNGVAISPDQKTLYVVSNENGTTAIERLDKGTATQADKVTTPLRKGFMALLAYDLAPEGTAKFRKVLVDYTPQDGPDGLTVDREGNLWVAVRAENRPGICVYSPEGKELAYLPTEVPTNVGFARGKDANLLYITAGKSLYRIRVNREGYHLPPAK